MTTIGHKIRKLRELKDLKQEQMADMLGLSATAYGNIERDETNVSHERLEQIAKVFGISVVDLLSFDEKNVFNNISNSGGNNGHANGIANYYSFPEDVKKLYEDKIRLQDEKIDALQKEIEQLKKGR